MDRDGRHRTFGKKEWWSDACELVRTIQELMKVAHDRRAKYFNARHRSMEFAVGDWVYLKIKSFKDLIGLHDVFHVSVQRKALVETSVVVELTAVPVEEDLRTKVRAVGIEDSEVRQLQNKEEDFLDLFASEVLSKLPCCGATLSLLLTSPGDETHERVRVKQGFLASACLCDRILMSVCFRRWRRTLVHAHLKFEPLFDRYASVSVAKYKGSHIFEMEQSRTTKKNRSLAGDIHPLAPREDHSLLMSGEPSFVRALGGPGSIQDGGGEELLFVPKEMKWSGVQSALYNMNPLSSGLVTFMGALSARNVCEALPASKSTRVGLHVVSYNTMIKGYTKAGRADKAASRFREMPGNGVDPDKITYLTLIQCHYAEGSFYDCLALYHEMEEKEIEIPPHAYSLVISGLCKENRPFDALMVFDKMSQRGCSPNITMYTALIDSFAKIGNEEQAMGLLQKMKADGFEPDEVTYGALINCFSKGGKLDKAMEWFEFCKANGIMVNAIFYSTLIDGFGKAGKIDEAKKLFNEMRDNGFVPDTYCYNALIDSFAKAGMMDDARAMFQRMEEEGCDQTVYTFTIMMDGLFRKHKNEEALKIWCRMIDKGITPTPASFRVLSGGLCLSGKFDRAMKILDELAPMGVVPETAHEDMIRVLCKAGRIEHACRLADEIVDKGREIPGKVRTMMINSLRKAGNADSAIKLVHSRIGIGYDRVGSIKRRVKFLTLMNI
ncbi:Pentatricopeptide repeat-containing protein [Platanthera guangdongensis]|uniref:Pentatricopeptide repeat-containing protein n=1 Tax=Platanthera guangdongensis TaxID=2320717 RepID=A0ABR2MSZ3_9ASPA